MLSLAYTSLTSQRKVRNSVLHGPTNVDSNC